MIQEVVKKCFEHALGHGRAGVIGANAGVALMAVLFGSGFEDNCSIDEVAQTAGLRP
jgi:hypothetical protein